MPNSVKRVDILAVGNARVIVPAGESWDLWFARPGVSADFMQTRDQPADQERAAL
jgi:antitoxin VapB